MKPQDQLDYPIEWAASAWKNLRLHIPVDLTKVRRSIKLFIKHIDLAHDVGYIFQTEKRWYIAVNSRHEEVRQRFTIAHEICEYLLVDYEQKHGKCLITNPEKKENFCNKFAAHLLMPEEQLKEMAKELYHSRKNDKTSVLAKRFGVSDTAMRIRLIEVGLLGYNKPASPSCPIPPKGAKP